MGNITSYNLCSKIVRYANLESTKAAPGKANAIYQEQEAPTHDIMYGAATAKMWPRKAIPLNMEHNKRSATNPRRRTGSAHNAQDLARAKNSRNRASISMWPMGFLRIYKIIFHYFKVTPSEIPRSHI